MAGLTIGCARCHDHKYDPITQKEFYRLLAFFNNVPEQGKVTRVGNPPAADQGAHARRWTLRPSSLDRRIGHRPGKPGTHLASATRRGADPSGRRRSPAKCRSRIDRSLVVHFPARRRLARCPRQADRRQVRSAARPHLRRANWPRRPEFDGERFIDAGDVADFARYDEVQLYGAWIYPAALDRWPCLSRMDEDDRYIGYDLLLDGGKVQADLVGRIARRLDARRNQAAADAERLASRAGRPTTVRASAKGVRIYVDGEPVRSSDACPTRSATAIKTHAAAAHRLARHRQPVSRADRRRAVLRPRTHGRRGGRRWPAPNRSARSSRLRSASARRRSSRSCKAISSSTMLPLGLRQALATAWNSCARAAQAFEKQHSHHDGDAGEARAAATRSC